MTQNDAALQPGTILDSGVAKYKIVKVLGRGGFGVTYKVTGQMKIGNVITEANFAIKEHYPEMFAERTAEGAVNPLPGKEADYKASLDDFKAEARKLQKMADDNPNIVKVNEVFEWGGTAYYVMQYINGKSLTGHVADSAGRKLSFEEAMTLLTPIFDAVDRLHKAKINHLDIKPDNIMLHAGIDGSTVPVLIDFGLSVHYKKNGDKTSVKGVQGVSEGYSPLEQYVGVNEFRPETDIYALAATLLYAVTGQTPAGAAELRVADLRPSLERIMSTEAAEGLCKALAKSPDDRTSSVSVFKADLGVSPANTDNKTRVIGTKTTRTKSSGKNNLPWIIGAVGLAALVVGCIFLFRSGGGSSDTAVVPGAEEVIDEILSPTDEVEVVEEETVTTEPEGEPVTKNETEIESESRPAPIEKNEPVTQSAPAAVTSGTLSLGYGTWKGGIRNGKADGEGRVVFSTNYRYLGTSENIQVGYYLEGTYENGKLVMGRLYDGMGNYITTLMP